MKLLIFVVLICFLHEINAYKNYTVENSDICSRATKRSIKLGSGSSSALFLTQRRLNDHTMNWKEDFLCSFEIKTKSLIGSLLDEDVGVFAVIQSMKLRRNEHRDECIDYIQFKDRKGHTSSKFCGNLDAVYAMDSHRNNHKDDDYFDDSDDDDKQVSVTSFDDPSGQLTVYIVIDKAALVPGEETDLKVAFTMYKHCRHSGYQACADDRSKCIYQAFFNDGIINCPNYDCVDEGGCKPLTPINVDKPLSIGSHILIGSGTSLVVSFGIFICCIYTCRKYGKLCWSEDFSRQPVNVHPPPPQQHVAHVSNAESDTLTIPVVPSAPPVSALDKDLPPSYDSLFPHPNMNATR